MSQADPGLTVAHEIPQLPQLLAVVRLVSQPSFTLLLQSPQPEAQLGLHVPLAQVFVE